MQNPMKLDRSRGPLFLLLFGLLLPLGGCDILDEGQPETAKVIIEGGGGEAFTLVTSDDFDVTTDETGESRDLFFYSADTILVTPPFTKTYSLGSRVRFYLKGYRDGELPQAMNIRVLIGGDQRYNVTTALDEVEPEFVYTYR